MSVSRNRIKAIIIIIIVLGGVLSYAIYTAWSDSQMNATELMWGVDEGDAFVYTVQVFGFNYTQEFDSIYLTYTLINQSLTLSCLNNTRISVQITKLPDIPDFIDSAIFVNTIMSVVKIQVMFENGTALSERYSSVLITLLSSVLLPIGDWPLMDSLFPDADPDITVDRRWYILKPMGTTFLFKYTSSGPDYASGWIGDVALDTGVPQNVTLWDWHGIDDYSYDVNLSIT